MDAQEKKWFHRFYDGTWLVKGWKARMQEILSVFQSRDQDAVRSQMESLGHKIGREWARDNSVRRIDTSMLQQWGDDLSQARDKGAMVLAEEISRIERDVDEILTA